MKTSIDISEDISKAIAAILCDPTINFNIFWRWSSVIRVKQLISINDLKRNNNLKYEPICCKGP